MMTSHRVTTIKDPLDPIWIVPQKDKFHAGVQNRLERRGGSQNLKNLNDKGNKYGYLLINYHDLFCKYSEW